MPQSDPSEELLDELPSLPPEPRTRFGSAWQVLRGYRLVDRQIQAEWFEYQQIFNDLLQRLSAQLARQAKSERKRVKSLLQSPPDPPSQRELPLSAPSRKSELRRRFASVAGPPQRPNNPSNGRPPFPPEESP